MNEQDVLLRAGGLCEFSLKGGRRCAAPHGDWIVREGDWRAGRWRYLSDEEAEDRLRLAALASRVFRVRLVVLRPWDPIAVCQLHAPSVSRQKPPKGTRTDQLALEGSC